MRHYCNSCKGNVVAVKQQPSHVVHGILSLLTFGFWLWIWLLVALSPKWNCRECGSRTYGGYSRTMFRNVVLITLNAGLAVWIVYSFTG